MALSAESFGNYRKLFRFFKYYNGFASTHPKSSVRIYYRDSTLPIQSFVPRKPHSSYIRGATYVSSTNCYRLLDRVRLVRSLEKYYRVDRLGKCHRDKWRNDTVFINESAPLPKIKALSHYLFHLAFENTVEKGYVTEKVFDGLSAGESEKILLAIVPFI